jgi:hypothetical protein
MPVRKESSETNSSPEDPTDEQVLTLAEAQWRFHVLRLVVSSLVPHLIHHYKVCNKCPSCHALDGHLLPATHATTEIVVSTLKCIPCIMDQLE